MKTKSAQKAANKTNGEMPKIAFIIESINEQIQHGINKLAIDLNHTNEVMTSFEHALIETHYKERGYNTSLKNGILIISLGDCINEAEA